MRESRIERVSGPAFLNLKPAPPPFSAMNQTPADSRRRRSSSLWPPSPRAAHALAGAGLIYFHATTAAFFPIWGGPCEYSAD